jgi:putative heme-binding domain-containing protein
MSILTLARCQFLVCALLLLPSSGFSAERPRRVPKPKQLTATPAESLKVLPGFKAQLLHSATESEGSWICMTIDAKGRLIISPQAMEQPLLRVTLSRSGEVSRIEPIPAPVHSAMGLLYAHDSLYVSGHGPSGTGLYRLIDANHNDIFETNEIRFLKRIAGEGEHGYHALVLGPDQMIYMMNGNHTKLPPDLAPTSPHKNYQEDFLLPRQWDANGHAVGILAPGGHILRCDPEGKRWELVLAGFRNAYDFDFNPKGEIFTFDSDMEWDWGLPWYRPIRIIHCVPGGEYGWRSGSSKWPDYYPDSLPAVLNIGIGSPTGVKFGTRSKFPPAYREALFAQDWSYGRLFAVHLAPHGASYNASYEVFLQGQPLNLTHLEFGRDGAMYFITGGRGTQSGLYRVSYDAKTLPPAKKTEVKVARDPSAPSAVRLRRKLEAFYHQSKPRAISFAWPRLSSSDRFIRYAARIVLEWQDVAAWKGRALAETNADAGLTALLALARCGGKDTQPELLHALEKFPFGALTRAQELDKLRLLGLSFIRQGHPEPSRARLIAEELNAFYPADDECLNRELSQVLIYLEAPGVVAKTLHLLDQAKTQEEQAHYVFHLRNLKTGWTLEEHKHYFNWLRFAQAAAQDKAATLAQDHLDYPWAAQTNRAERHPAQLIQWFKDAGRDYSDGASYSKYLANFRKDAVAALSESEQLALSSWTADYAAMSAFKPSMERHFVKEWKMAELEPIVGRVSSGRNYNQGKAAFGDAQCMLCHRFGNEGGSVGPELGAVAKKYSTREILESIVEPSKVISEQYQNFNILRKDGEAEVGRIVDETDDKLVLQPSPLLPDRVEIPKSQILERRPSKVSPMPEGLLNSFTEDEILDLLAYLVSAGDQKAPNFQKEEATKR